MLTVYSSPSCAWCDKLKEYLTVKGAQFTEVDVSQSQENLRRLLKVSGQHAVPVTVGEHGEVVIGFDRNKIDELIQ